MGEGKKEADLRSMKIQENKKNTTQTTCKIYSLPRMLFRTIYDFRVGVKSYKDIYSLTTVYAGECFRMNKDYKVKISLSFQRGSISDRLPPIQVVL